MKQKNGRRQLTYEEIARKYDMTPAKAHSIVKQAYNKMVKALMEKEKINIFDAVLILREYFNMSEQEAYDKLNDEHKVILKNYAIKEFDIRSKKGKGLATI
jgi:phosphopantetheinyl transferase (holo-ACP synthase)